MKVSSRIVRGPIEAIVAQDGAVRLPSYEENRTVIADYQQMALRRANHHWAFADLQHHLLFSMQAEQIHLKAIRSARPAEQHREHHEMYVEFAKLPLQALRRVADGMAFRFLGYDMSLVQALNGNAVGVNDLSSSGALHELQLAAALTDYHQPGAQVLHCALSDLLGIGDIIVKTESCFEVVEVKKGKSARGARVSRQKERLDALTEFFRAQRGDVGGVEARLLRVPARRHALSDLENALRRCRASPPVLLEVSPFQTVWCCDCIGNPEVDFRAFLLAAQRDATARFGNNWIAFKSYEQRNHVGVTVPMAAYPMDSDTIADLLLGGLVYVSFISVDGIAARMRSRGWHAVNVFDIAADKNIPGFPVLHVFREDNPGRNYSFPVDLLVDCGVSLVDLDSLLSMLEETTEREDGHWIPVYADESALWR